MYQDGVRYLERVTAQLAADSDKLCTLATRENAPIEITQALLVASWSLRSAKFALQLAAKPNESNGTLGPSPSSNTATGGNG